MILIRLRPKVKKSINMSKSSVFGYYSSIAFGILIAICFVHLLLFGVRFINNNIFYYFGLGEPSLYVSDPLFGKFKTKGSLYWKNPDQAVIAKSMDRKYDLSYDEKGYWLNNQTSILTKDHTRSYLRDVHNVLSDKNVDFKIKPMIE